MKKTESNKSIGKYSTGNPKHQMTLKVYTRWFAKWIQAVLVCLQSRAKVLNDKPLAEHVYVCKKMR